MQDFWTHEKVDQLRKLWPTHSGTAIAVIIGSSKGAILGKSRRLGLPPKEPEPRTPEQIARSLKRANQTAELNKRKAAAAGVPLTDIQARATRAPKSIVERPASRPSAPAAPPAPKKPTLTVSARNPCQWPLGHPGRPNFRMCDAPGVIGRSYCPEHCARAYTKVPTWARDPSRPASLSSGTNPRKW